MRRRKHLLAQYGLLFVICAVIMVSGVTGLAFVGFREQARISEYETAHSQALQVAKYVSDVQCYQYLIEWWYENSDQLRDYQGRLEELSKNEKASLDAYGGRDPSSYNLQDISTMNPDQRDNFCLLFYAFLVGEFQFTKSIQKHTLDGPILVKADGNGVYPVLADVSDKPYDVGDTIKYRIGERKYNYEKDNDKETKDNIFSFKEKGKGYFSGLIYPISSGDDIIAFVIIKIRDDYLQKTSFRYSNTILAIMVVYTVFIIALVLYALYKYIVKPLKQVESGLLTYTETRDSDRVIHQMRAVKSSNEIGRLADGIEQLARRIKESEYAKKRAEHLLELSDDPMDEQDDDIDTDE